MDLMDQQERKSKRIVVLRANLQVIVAMILWGGLLFGAAGSFQWFRGWLFWGLWLITMALNLLVLFRCNPELVRARTKRNRGVERFDIPILAVVTLCSVALPLVAGWDALRYGWSVVPRWWIGPGVILHVLGNAAMLWAMMVNPFAEKKVRIQTDRYTAVNRYYYEKDIEAFRKVLESFRLIEDEGNCPAIRISQTMKTN